MPPDPNHDEWKALKDQLEKLRHQSGPEPGIDEIFDAQIRHRFGEMIARASVGALKKHQE